MFMKEQFSGLSLERRGLEVDSNVKHGLRIRRRVMKQAGIKTVRV